MISNVGQLTNEEVFWKTFKAIYGKGVIRDLPIFDEFYEKEFQCIQDVCRYNVLAETLVEKCKERDLMIILATNPIFPTTATYSRIKWAGLSKDDFALITTY